MVPVSAELAYGKGGWVRYRDRRIPLAYVRFAEFDGRLRPTEVYVPAADGSPMDPRALRQLPLGDIEAAANDPDDGASLRAQLNMPAPDLRRASASYALGFGSQKKKPQDWVEAMIMAQDPRWDVPQAPSPAPLPPLRTYEIDMPSLRLTAEAGRDHGDDFYRDVARLYGLLTRLGQAPAPLLAEANNVAVSTAHRWVKEARRRGLLPAGRPGKAG